MTMRIATFARVLTGVLGLAAVSACGNSPTEPFDGVKKLEVTGPTTAAPGQTLRYVATAHYVDGSTRDVTGDVTWNSTNSGLLSFTSPGVVTAKFNGEADVTAIFHVFNVKVHVLVLEPGTFKLTGTIKERGGGGLPFGGRISILSGVGQGKLAFGGAYMFYGVAGPIRLEVSSTGYVSGVHDIDVTGHTVHDFELVPVETPVDVAGDWTLTLGPPPPGCPDGLPALAQTRSYSLAVIQKGTELELRLRSPTLQVVSDFNTGGTVSGQRVSLCFSNSANDFDEEVSINLLDKLSATETFSFTGRTHLSRQRVADRDEHGRHFQILVAARDAAAVVGMQDHQLPGHPAALAVAAGSPVPWWPPGGRHGAAGRLCRDHVRGLLADHVDRADDEVARDPREHRRIHHAEALDAVHLEVARHHAPVFAAADAARA